MSDCVEWHLFRQRDGYGKAKRAGRSWRAHRFVYEQTVGPIPPGMFVMHTCDNPPCVNPEHLRLGTQDDNMADMVAKGRQARGEGNGRHKIIETQVAEIRDLHASGMSYRKLARQFGLSLHTIGCLVRGETWRHI